MLSLGVLLTNIPTHECMSVLYMSVFCLDHTVLQSKVSSTSNTIHDYLQLSHRSLRYLRKQLSLEYKRTTTLRCSRWRY